MQPKLLTCMTTSTPALPASEARLLLRERFAPWPPVAEQRRLLLLSDDEKFWQTLLPAAGEAGRVLVKNRAAAAAPGPLRLSNPWLCCWIGIPLPRPLGTPPIPCCRMPTHRRFSCSRP